MNEIVLHHPKLLKIVEHYRAMLRSIKHATVEELQLLVECALDDDVELPIYLIDEEIEWKQEIAAKAAKKKSGTTL
jgi:hypothetical protein